MSDPVEVLDFWLGAVGPEGWYLGSAEIDDACKAHFGAELEALANGGLEHWRAGPAPCLAYLIIADQFSRNIHRGTAKAFATDPQAREAARVAVVEGWDLDVPPPERQFFYLPFEHSENLADQDMAVELFSERMADHPESLLHAKAHREIIRQFGRFPFRNKALGRETTPEEQKFMDEGAYAGLVERLRGQGAE